MKTVELKLLDGTLISVNPNQVGYFRRGEKRGTTIVSVQGLALVVSGYYSIIKRKLQSHA